MWNLCDYHMYELTLFENKIVSLPNLIAIDAQKIFSSEVNKPHLAKLYLIRDVEFYQYVGTTFQPINFIISQSLKADGLNDYKWQNEKKVQLFVWTFECFNKTEIENIEAEIVFKIREKYGKWLYSQSEIHFNNKFLFGKVIADDIFNYLEEKYPKYEINQNKNYAKYLFEEPSQYGLRGDPYLWKELKAKYEFTKINSESDFKKFLFTTFKEITGFEHSINKVYNVDKYGFGGLSSGSICCDFWIEKGFPLLLKRYNKKKTTANSRFAQLRIFVVNSCSRFAINFYL